MRSRKRERVKESGHAIEWNFTTLSRCNGLASECAAIIYVVAPKHSHRYTHTDTLTQTHTHMLKLRAVWAYHKLSAGAEKCSQCAFALTETENRMKTAVAGSGWAAIFILYAGSSRKI